MKRLDDDLNSFAEDLKQGRQAPLSRSQYSLYVDHTHCIFFTGLHLQLVVNFVAIFGTTIVLILMLLASGVS